MLSLSLTIPIISMLKEICSGVNNMAKPRIPKKASDNKVVNHAPAASDELMTTATRGNGGNGANGAAKKTTRKKTVSKPAVVKDDPRATVVPVSLEDEIRQAAYLMAERRGFEPGHEVDDWFAAEREVLERYQQHGA